HGYRTGSPNGEVKHRPLVASAGHDSHRLARLHALGAESLGHGVDLSCGFSSGDVNPVVVSVRVAHHHLVGLTLKRVVDKGGDATGVRRNVRYVHVMTPLAIGGCAKRYPRTH